MSAKIANTEEFLQTIVSIEAGTAEVTEEEAASGVEPVAIVSASGLYKDKALDRVVLTVNAPADASGRLHLKPEEFIYLKDVINKIEQETK